jgi:hypothetical protein
MNAKDLIPACEKALNALICHLDDSWDLSAAPLNEIVAKFTRIVSAEGLDGLSERFGLSEHQVSLVSGGVRRLGNALAKHDDRDGISNRNLLIAILRFLYWIEILSARIPGLEQDSDIQAYISEELGRKQIRALELILRSLIHESYGNQEQLITRLRSIFKDEFEALKLNADPEDILTGTTFGQIANLFTAKREFDRYQYYYEETPFLTFLKNRRKTISLFLEDIRIIRNAFSHNRRINNIQLSLLDLYYEELIMPIQLAHDEGQTRVNPETYFDVSSEELKQYFNNLHEDVVAVRDDIADLKNSIQQPLETVTRNTEQISGTASRLKKNLAYLSVAIVFVAAVLIIIFNQNIRIREDTISVKKSTGIIEKNIHRSTKELKSTAGQIEEANRQLTGSVEVISAGFEKLTKLGGLIAGPQNPEEYYHNARIYEQRGDYLHARISYESLFKFRLEVIDPHLRYQFILKMQEGRVGAREQYALLQNNCQSYIVDYAIIHLLDREGRIREIEKFIKIYPEFTPAYFDLARQFSESIRGRQSFSDKVNEKKALEQFVELADRGKLLRYFLDKEMANSMLDSASIRLKALELIEDNAINSPVKLTAMRHSSGSAIYLNILEKAREIFYRLEDEPDYQSTGFANQTDSVTGQQIPNYLIQLPAIPRPVRLKIKYLDIHQDLRGPFELKFDPTIELVRSNKKILEITLNHWISYRNFNGKLMVYFSHLLSYRSAIQEIRYGIDTDSPTELFRFPPPDVKNPYNTGNLETWITVPPETEYVTVSLKYADNTLSQVQKFYRN